MADTNKQFDQVTAKCRKIFVEKMQDYGPSWRIFRLHGITDQLYIKVCNIRQRQESGISLVGDDIEGNLRAIVNYGVTAIIQSRNSYADAIDMTRERATQLYDEVLQEAKDLMLRKNHDYGEAWRDMFATSLTDIILTKINRNKSIAANDNQTLISEGADGNYFDMLNYAVFYLIKVMENETK